MTRSGWRWLAGWTGIAVALHALWEFGQLPGYALWHEADRWTVVRYVLHCTLGDALIAATTYLVAAGVSRRMDWPASRPWRGGLITVTAGVAYTAVSEWINVYVIGRWAYAQIMPLVFGVGLAPLLQWVVVPALTLMILRKQSRRRDARNAALGRGGS